MHDYKGEAPEKGRFRAAGPFLAAVGAGRGGGVGEEEAKWVAEG